MRTKEVEYDERKFTIRKIGAGAYMEYTELLRVAVPAILAPVIEKAAAAAKDPQSIKPAEILGDTGGAIAGALLEWNTSHERARAKARMFLVVSCTVKPDFTIETIDEEIDEEEAGELYDHIMLYNKLDRKTGFRTGGATVTPFRLASS